MISVSQNMMIFRSLEDSVLGVAPQGDMKDVLHQGVMVNLPDVRLREVTGSPDQWNIFIRLSRGLLHLHILALS